MGRVQKFNSPKNPTSSSIPLPIRFSPDQTSPIQAPPCNFCTLSLSLFLSLQKRNLFFFFLLFFVVFVGIPSGGGGALNNSIDLQISNLLHVQQFIPLKEKKKEKENSSSLIFPHGDGGGNDDGDNHGDGPPPIGNVSRNGLRARLLRALQLLQHHLGGECSEQQFIHNGNGEVWALWQPALCQHGWCCSVCPSSRYFPEYSQKQQPSSENMARGSGSSSSSRPNNNTSNKFSSFEPIEAEAPRMTPIRPPEKRQRVPSAYNRFIKEEIQRIKASNPDISHREAFSTAAKNWAHFPHIHFGLKLDGNKQGKADQAIAGDHQGTHKSHGFY